LFIDTLTVRKRATVSAAVSKIGRGLSDASTPWGTRMKNTIRISVGIAALISAAALANAQTTPQHGANYHARTLGHNRAAPSHQNSAAARRVQPGQAQEAGRKGPTTTPSAEDHGAQPGQTQGAEHKEITGGSRTGAIEGSGAKQEQKGITGQEQDQEQQGITGAREGTVEQRDAIQGDRAIDERSEPGQRPYAERGATKPGGPGATTTQRGEATPTPPGQARTEGAAISPEQQAWIRDKVRNDDSARIDHPDFGLNVGAVVPRSEHLAVLPEDIITIAPRFRGYGFLIVEDDIVIVDPQTYRVAAVIPEADGPAPIGPGPGPGGPGARPGGPGPRPGGPCG